MRHIDAYLLATLHRTQYGYDMGDVTALLSTHFNDLLTEYEVGDLLRNPPSTKQIVQRMWELGYGQQAISNFLKIGQSTVSYHVNHAQKAKEYVNPYLHSRLSYSERIQQQE